jgi:riboflavin kinase/FMN adenylyltransferase
MQVFSSVEAADANGALRGCAAAIGNFDGVHLGHQRLCEDVKRLAAARGAKSAVLTFEPHPVRILQPAMAPPPLTPLPRKLELLAGCEIDAVVVQSFDSAYSQTSAEEFVARDLAGRLHAADIVVGLDFTAGHERARVDALRTVMSPHGIELHVVEPVTADGLRISSTKVREFLLEGNVEAAAVLLARLHDVDGLVEKGAGRGRGFGFATANVRPIAMLPATGVYAVRALLGDHVAPESEHGPRPQSASLYGGVCNVGVKPTFETTGLVTLEVHLFDHDGRDLYGERIRVGFVKRLRDECRFPSASALRAQIAKDVATAREVLRHSL